MSLSGRPRNARDVDPRPPSIRETNMETKGQISWDPVEEDDIVRIHFPDSDRWVDVKRYITEADDNAATRAAKAHYRTSQVNRAGRRAAKNGAAEDEGIYWDSGAYRLTMLIRLIKAWNFKRKDQTPITLSPATIDVLPIHTRDYILDRVAEENPEWGISDEERQEKKESSPDSSPEIVTSPTT